MIRDSLGLLVSLMGAWVAILDEVARGEMAEVSQPAALRFDLPRVEGTALACMCSSQPEVRKAFGALFCPAHAFVSQWQRACIMHPCLVQAVGSPALVDAAGLVPRLAQAHECILAPPKLTLLLGGPGEDKGA